MAKRPRPRSEGSSPPGDSQPDGAPSAVRRPITSLIAKSEKALMRLTPGSWQHRRLADTLAALRVGAAFVRDEAEQSPATSRIPPGALRQARAALTALIGRVEATLLRCAPGSAQHTLQKNRLAALRWVVSRMNR